VPRVGSQGEEIDVAVLLACLASVCGGSADFLGGLLSKRLPSVVVVALSQAGALLVALVLLAVVRPGLTEPGRLWWVVLAGLFMMLGLVTFYAALARGTMGVIAPVSALGVIVPVAWGVIRLGETPSTLAWAGAVLGIVGVVLASGPELSGGGQASAVLLAAVSGIGFGGCTAFIAQAAPAGVVWTTVGVKASVVALTLPVILVRFARRRVSVDAAIVPRVALISVIDVAGILLLALATTRGLVSVVSVVSSLYPVVTVALARGLLAERMRAVQYAGAVLALGGVALLAST
jgi:drug/metabolite transporter (DMT)-like permease